MLVKCLRTDLLVILLISIFSAEITAKSNTHISGFGSIVGYHADGSELAFRSNIASSHSGQRGEIEFLDLSLVGFQLNHQFNANWELVGQLVVRSEPTEDVTDRIKLFTLNYSPNADWLIRVGRFSPKLYLLSDTRFIGYAQDSIYPVHDFYAQIPLTSIDGFDIGYQKRFGSILFTANAYSGVADIWAGIDGASVITSLKDILGANLGFEYESWLVRFGYTQASHDGFGVDQRVEQFLTSLAFPPAEFGVAGWTDALAMYDAYKIKDTKFSYSSLAFEYNHFDGLLRGELGKLSTDSYLAPDTTAGYLQYSYRIDKFAPFIIVSAIHSEDGYKPQTLPGAELLAVWSQVTQSDFAASFNALEQSLNIKFEQQSIAFGARLDLFADVAFKVQFERNWVGQNGGGLWIRESISSNAATTIDTLTFGIDWVF
ncbi:hypothetical protein [Catenovulum agarivorans]|uniref:hypothetical protein n=1 Tax=Catenovulum agarivorans TaxID=1172192 RepID=UPI000376AA95|nr:hypothetical protein [Catenovulum agarivorans]